MSLTDHLSDYFEIDDDLASPFGIHRRNNMTQKPDAVDSEDALQYAIDRIVTSKSDVEIFDILCEFRDTFTTELLREVEAAKGFIGGIYKLLDDHGDCERGCMTCIAMRRIRETYLVALEGESR